MKLNMSKRTGAKKGEVKELRRIGSIPSVLYSSKRPAENITISGAEFAASLRQIPQGRLATTTFSLSDGNAEIKAIVKDIQYHPTTYQVLHIDFVELVDGVSVNVKVPVECTGVADCSGIKLGGFLRQVLRSVKIECLPNSIPAKFEIDVRELGIKQTRRVSDIAMPQGIRSLVNDNEVVVVIAKR
ncbi:MAG: 50S ribosomal protein L25/general stress protein Ctc [Chlamydiae bacterium]|nr:50S ribosomal protein L25/general stress protein Ctc [Chlamydiota bacterium]